MHSQKCKGAVQNYFQETFREPNPDRWNFALEFVEEPDPEKRKVSIRRLDGSERTTLISSHEQEFLSQIVIFLRVSDEFRVHVTQ